MDIFNFFRRKRFGDTQRTEFVEAVGGMLEVQMAIITDRDNLPPLFSKEGEKALGYIYGFIDAALRSVGQDMSDISIGIPITFQIFRRIFPGCEEACIEYLRNSLGKNELLMQGILVGGQQYLDYMNGKLTVPMGLARYLIQSKN